MCLAKSDSVTRVVFLHIIMDRPYWFLDSNHSAWPKLVVLTATPPRGAVSDLPAPHLV